MNGQEYDLLVVGGGPGGYVAAIRAAQLGLRTALVEKAQLGGICLNWGCIPTKALLRSAEVLRTVREAARFGVRCGDVGSDLGAMVERSRAVAGQLQRGVDQLMKKNGVTVIQGHARLAGAGRLQVSSVNGELELFAPHIVLATGARARVLPGLAPDGDSLWSYREALQPKAVPRRLLVIGAGAIGIEFASFYHTLGSDVHVVEMSPRILPAEDEDVSAYVTQALRKEGLHLHTGCRVLSSRRDSGTWTVQLEGAGSLEVDVILSAAGIVGNVEELGLESTAVEVSNGHIVTDAFGATAQKGVYAIGDVAGAPWLAHKASHEALVCIENIAGHAPQPLDARRIPACTYSHPQVASVGLTEAQARDAGYALRVGKFPFAANGKAIALGDTGGFAKVIFDAGTGELLGAHLVGAEVTEMIPGFALASELETTEQELMATIYPHPTQSEVLQEAVFAAYGRALHL